MSANYKDVSKTLVLTTWMFCLLSPAFSIAADSESEETPRIVVLDPGHGGTDPGVIGPEGGTEKSAALRLSHLIASEPEENLRFVLTRTDDYRLDIQHRTSLANHAKADLFISLHAAANTKIGADMTIIYHSAEIAHPPSDPIPWRQTQNKNLRSSVTLAETIRKRIDQTGKLGKVDVRRAPILLLEGADMPAVLIETGRLANPLAENSTVLHDLATAVRRGIADYFEMKSGKSR